METKYLVVFNSSPFRTVNSDEYDGNIQDYDNFLLEFKPLGWVGERAKLQSMMSARGFSGILKSVKIRAFNPDTVVPSLVILRLQPLQYYFNVDWDFFFF